MTNPRIKVDFKEKELKQESAMIKILKQTKENKQLFIIKMNTV
jgi:hypothetical protein